MKLRERFTQKKILLTLIVLLAALGVACYFALRRPPRVAMERYVPATALAFIEINNLTDVIDGLTNTKAWRELAPTLGLSSQLRQIGLGADLISRTGFGPDEAVVAGRAQYAIALTSLEAETGATDEGPYLHFKPRFALVAQTHAKPETAARLVRDRVQILARRIYGESASTQTEDYFGSEVLTFRGAQADRQLVASAAGSVVLIANHVEAIKSCLDSISGRAATLAEDATLKLRRPAIDQGAAIFAYLTEAGIEKLAQFGPAILASRFTTDADQIGSVANLFGHLSKQTAAGLLYSSEFVAGGVTEKYLTVLRPGIAEALAEPLKAATTADFVTLQGVPREAKDFTILNVESVGELPNRLLKSLAPRVDVVAALALREFVDSFRKQLGFETADARSTGIGDEVTLVRLNDDEPMAMFVRVTSREQVLPVVANYLAQGGASVSSEQRDGTEVIISTNEDGRAAAFVADYLVLATRDQITRIIAAQSGGKVVASDKQLKEMIAGRPRNASIISYKPDVTEAGELMLALARITRVSDGSRDLLEQDSVRGALDRLPPSVSFTEFRDYGIYTETRSAVGNYSLIATLVGGEDEQLQ